MSPTYAVMGATGMQGGAALDRLLRGGVDPSSIRAATRDPNSAGGHALSAKGAQVVSLSQSIGSETQGEIGS